jgi:hypothetical protein
MKVILSIHDEGYFRNASCALNLISTLLFVTVCGCSLLPTLHSKKSCVALRKAILFLSINYVLIYLW